RGRSHVCRRLLATEYGPKRREVLGGDQARPGVRLDDAPADGRPGVGRADVTRTVLTPRRVSRGTPPGLAPRARRLPARGPRRAASCRDTSGRRGPSPPG